MDIRILIKGGTVVDGSGGDAIKADVRVAEGRIAEFFGLHDRGLIRVSGADF
jgi:N-acyl-D-aspartate/D-glutamate deacylase